MTAPKTPHQRFTMPRVSLGDPVLWAPTASRLSDPAPAIVTKVGDEAIGLIFFPPDTRAGTPRDGVRFHADPANQRIESDAGVWDFTEAHKRLLKLEEGLAAQAAGWAEK